MSAGDGGADIRAMKALQEQVDRAGADAVKLAGLVDALSLRVRDLESPADALERVNSSLADAAAKIAAEKGTVQ